MRLSSCWFFVVGCWLLVVVGCSWLLCCFGVLLFVVCCLLLVVGCCCWAGAEVMPSKRPNQNSGKFIPKIPNGRMTTTGSSLPTCYIVRKLEKAVAVSGAFARVLEESSGKIAGETFFLNRDML